MLRHYLAIALRNLRRSPFTAAINVSTLALGLVAFVAAYAVVAYWRGSDRQFANVDRTYVITASLEARDGSISTGAMPATNELYERYLRIDFPEFEAIARANVWNRAATVTAEGKGARVVAVGVDPEFLDIFELPFIAGDRETAFAVPNALLVTRATALRLFGTEEVLGKTIALGGNLIDATVTGVLDEIPEPSHMGNSRSATMKFDIMAPYALYERLRDAVNRPLPPRGAPPADGERAAGGSAPANGAAPPSEDAPPEAALSRHGNLSRFRKNF